MTIDARLSKALPQRCPYCLGEARVEVAPETEVLLIRGCSCAATRTLRVPEGLARRRWRELGVR
jgi:hypothetical protein